MTYKIKKNLPDVQILSRTVSQRIAAGEVIDRPYAAVRELLDNAIDAKATDISVYIQSGGIDEIRVSDNGHGMSEENLALCWLPHATSKLSTIDDLERIATLGFRGEALSSLAVCSRLEIISKPFEEAFRLCVHGGKVLEQGISSGQPGTTVSVKNLFFNLPARRQFLKSTRAETTLCRRAFLEKAAAHPEINFRLFIDGQLKTFLPSGSYIDRVSLCWPGLGSQSTWWESNHISDDSSVTIIHARPEISRKDRMYIHINVNRRRIDEYSLVQGVVHAYDSWLPGGTFPIAFVFIEIDPQLVDFNIHPAKREVRFRDLPSIRHQVIETIKDRLDRESYEKRSSIKAPLKENNAYLPSWKSAETYEYTAYNQTSYRAKPQQAEIFAETTRKLRESDHKHEPFKRFNPVPLEKNTEFRYLGQVMGVFLLAESSDSLFIVDQHAAHERILYEKLCNSEPVTEHLLFPLRLNLDRTALMRLELRMDRLERMGLKFEKNNDEWELTALPLAAKGLEGELVESIEDGIGSPEDFEKSLWADVACKTAVKDRNVLDDDAARQILRDAFNLDTPRCPHGRPIWFEISRNELFELMGRRV